MAKRRVTPRQLTNLARGREINFQKQLMQRGINLSPRPQIITQKVRQPAVHRPVNVNISLFKEFIGTKFLPIEINKTREDLNLQEVINHLFHLLNEHREAIISNQKRTDEIIEYLNFKDAEYQEKLDALQKENEELRKSLDELKDAKN
jgi:hypothetical protein